MSAGTGYLVAQEVGTIYLDGLHPEYRFAYAGLTLTLKELKSLFRYEKMRRAAVMKEMKRMANIVANRAGKKDPVFNKPVKTQGPRKTTIPNPEDVGDVIPSTRRWKNLYLPRKTNPKDVGYSLATDMHGRDL